MLFRGQDTTEETSIYFNPRTHARVASGKLDENRLDLPLLFDRQSAIENFSSECICFGNIFVLLVGMIGKYDGIKTQGVFDQISAPRSVSRTEVRRALKPSPFEGPERQLAAEMIQRMALGDETALATFYQRFAPMLYGLALKMMKDEKDAEDVLQEGFIYIWRKAAAYNPQLHSPFSWAVMIVRNKAIDRIRSRQSVARMVERATVEFSHFAKADERSADEPVFSELRANVRAALAQIPQEQRQAIELAFFGGLTHEEIAAHLATPLGTIKARIRRGMLRMRELVMEDG